MGSSLTPSRGFELSASSNERRFRPCRRTAYAASCSAHAACWAHAAPDHRLPTAPPCAAQVDVWAVGILAFELVVGDAPFFHDDEKETCRLIKEVGGAGLASLAQC